MRRRDFNLALIRLSAGGAASQLTSATNAIAARRQSKAYTINADRLRASLESLSQFGRNPEGGVSRVAWTKPGIEARQFVMDKLMSGINLKVRISQRKPKPASNSS